MIFRADLTVYNFWKKTGNILDYATERSEFTGVESVGFINLRYVWDGKFAIISQPCN